MEPGAPEKRIIKYTVRRKMTIRQVIKKIMIRLRLKKEQKKRMEKFPVSDILFANRTDEQWEEWKMELNRASSGFDL